MAVTNAFYGSQLMLRADEIIEPSNNKLPCIGWNAHREQFPSVTSALLGGGADIGVRPYNLN